MIPFGLGLAPKIFNTIADVLNWGISWRDHQVTCHYDNQVIVACWQSRTSKNAGITHLLRCLVFVEARHHCHLRHVYIDTKSNHLADDLSRDKFLSKVPGASLTPTPISPNCWVFSRFSKPIGHQLPGSISSAITVQPLLPREIRKTWPAGHETMGNTVLSGAFSPYSFNPQF